MSVVQKLKSFWFGPGDVDYLDDDDGFGEIFEEPPTAQLSNLNSKVVDHPSAALSSQVMVMEPRTFEESSEIVEHIRSRKSVLLNLHRLDSESSQRIVDFLSGATHAIDGNQQRIGDGVFLFAPATVTISSESSPSKAIKDVFWTASQPK